MKKYALSLTSAFTSPSIIKSRIVMMYQKTSHRIALSKFLLAIPVLALCLLVASFTQRTSIAKPNFDGTYIFLKNIDVNAKDTKKLSYIFTKGNKYLFRFVNTKTQESVPTPEKFRILDNDKQEMACTQTSEGWYYNNEKTGMFTVDFQNNSDTNVSMLLYFKNTQSTIIKVENGVFESPQILPAMPIYIAVTKQNEYPKEAFGKEIEGDAMVSTIVNTDGSLSDITIEKGLGYGCDEVALEKVRNLKNITPGRQEGKNVRTKMRIRVNFAIYPIYASKPEIPTEILQTVSLSTSETKITLQAGKKYVFTLTELEGLTKEDLEMLQMSLNAPEGFQAAYANASQPTIIYKPKETGDFKIKLNNEKPLKAGKLIIGTK